MSAIAYGYGTNGFTDHPVDDAVEIIAENGYGAVALTIGHPHLDPSAADWRERTERLARRIEALGLRVVVETGARFVTDPRRKHRPNLLDRVAQTRVAYLQRCVEIAQILGAECVSLFSGVLPEDVPQDEARMLLATRLAALTAFAAERGVRLAIEPEPGMLIETVSDALRLRAAIGAPANLGITVDLGHCLVVEPAGVAGALEQAGELLWNVQVDDMRSEAHVHLELGEGELDLPAALAVLERIGYRGIAAVELPRHSHDAPGLAARSIVALRAAGSGEHPWTVQASAQVRQEPARVHRLFAEAGRRVGRETEAGELPAEHAITQDDRARTALVAALAETTDPAASAARLGRLYREGDDAERRGVLRGLNALVAVERVWIDAGREIVADALRTNDPRLVAAAMGSFAAAHLDAPAWRNGVLKLVFMGVPLALVAGLDERRDDALAAMAGRFAAERRAAGRSIPDDLGLLQPALSER